MKAGRLIPWMALLLIGVTLVSLTLGNYPIDVVEIIRFFLHKAFGAGAIPEERQALLQNILIEVRFPRIFAAILVGASLSVSGAAFQAMFINPLVSPGLLGVLAGASFGAALGMILSKSWLAVQAGAFIFGLAAVFGALAIARIYGGNTLLMLILGGIITGSFFTSLLSIIKYVADPYSQLPAIVYWLMGGLSFADRKTVILASIPMGLGIALSLMFSNYLNILSMGDDEARALGVNVRAIRLVMISLATVISALTVVLAGMVGWVGLVIPHAARIVTGPDNRTLLPMSALMGACFMVIVDDLSRVLFTTEIPLGILTSLVGIPFFAIILRKARKGWY